jgi:hypothetical protein
MTPVELQAVGVEHDPQNASKVYPAGDLALTDAHLSHPCL